MRSHNTSIAIRRVQLAAALLGSVLAGQAFAAVPGITGATSTTTPGPTFYLSAGEMRSTQPNGQSVYAWGYGCTAGAALGGFLPAAIGPTQGANCPTAQMPGPTLIVHEGDVVTVVLTNNLPATAGATSVLFPGFAVATAGGTAGLLTQEAPSLANCNLSGTNAGCNTVTYTFTAGTPGTHSYYSGTQADLQIEMGLFGALIVLPSNPPATCTYVPANNAAARSAHSEADFRLSTAAYDNPDTCYDREYLFQLSEMNSDIHTQVETQVLTDKSLAAGTGCSSATGCLQVVTEPYIPNYFMINGRSMPDDMDPNYAGVYPNQPYNGNPHMHPGEISLLRIIGQGHWQHPFHEHANHVRILARDGNLLLSDTTANAKLAGPLMFTTTTTPGQTMDGLFYWTGKGLNWDAFGHGYSGDTSQCVPDANGYYTSVPSAANYFEWCGDHNKPLEKAPHGQVASGGPITLPEPNVLVNGAWYSGTPYFGADANARAVGATPIPPSGTILNSPSTEAGFAYMWHSHNEREITTDNVFPGGLMTMMLIDPRSFVIVEAN